MLKLWGRVSSGNVKKVLWCCGELDLPFEHVRVGGQYGGLDAPSYRKLNPNGRIPTIEDDGLVLWESNTIVRYLAAKYGADCLSPSSLGERAKVERWMDWQLCHMLPGMAAMFFALARAPEGERNMVEIEKSRVETEQAWHILERQLEKNTFIAGNTFTMADIPLGCNIYRWNLLPIEKPNLPNVQAWYQRLTERPPYKKWVMTPLSFAG